MTTAETSSAEVVLSSEQAAVLLELLRDAEGTGEAVQLVVDTTGDEPLVSVWTDDGIVGKAPVSSVVFE